MSEIKIGRGVGFPPYLLKDAKFSRAKAGGKIYCYITTPDEVKHAFTRHQVFRLSNRGGKYVNRLREFLKSQVGWDKAGWGEPEGGEKWPSEQEIQEGFRVIRETLKELGIKPPKE